MKRNYILILGVVISVFLAFACGDSDTTTTPPTPAPTTSPTGSYDKAIDYYNAGVDLHDTDPDAAMVKYNLALQNSNDIGEVYLNIGLIYINKNDYPNGIHYTKLALSTFERTNKKVSESQSLSRLKAICNNNLGVIYLRKDDKTTALSYFKKAMDTDPSYDTARNNYNSNK